MSKKIKLSSLQQDDKNFNSHTDFGMELLAKSIDKVGVIESITVSSDDKIISGNARQEKMAEKFGGEIDPIIIETDGTRPVILKRTDIKSGTKDFHEAALLANTVSKHNINLDFDKIEEVAISQFNIDIEEIGITVETTYKENEDEDDSVDLSDFGKSAESYLNSSLRQVVLIYENETHKVVLEKLSDIGKAYEIYEDNATVVLKLIEFYEQQR